MIENKARRILLGSAQFGMSYGIMNKYGQVPFAEVESILLKAYSAGINSIDTSGDYGNSEHTIGAILSKNPSVEFEVYSKNATDDIENSFNESQRRLKSVYGYSIHYFETFKNRPSVWADLRKLKEKGLVKKIGISLYSPHELEYLLDNGLDLDIIQIPSNLLDSRFTPYFEDLQQRKIEMHIRSVFLQGLFFKDMDMVPPKLDPLKKPIRDVQNYCLKKGVTIQDFALNFMLYYPQVSKVLIGVHSCKQLEENIESLKTNLTQEDIEFVRSLHVSDESLLNPSNWK